MIDIKLVVKRVVLLLSIATIITLLDLYAIDVYWIIMDIITYNYMTAFIGILSTIAICVYIILFRMGSFPPVDTELECTADESD